MVWPIVSYYPDICIVKFKTLTQDSQSLDWRLKQGPPPPQIGSRSTVTVSTNVF
jgi:hypothetical protein